MMKEKAGLCFLYCTVLGRIILKVLVNPQISKLVGHFMDLKVSKIFIRHFMNKNNIDLENIEIPCDGFNSFNNFFCRKRLITEFDKTPDHLCSPCDGWLSYFHIDAKSCFEIKHTKYSLHELLGDEKLAEEFSGGTALIFRLTPSNYHRYSYIDEGTVLKKKKIRGILHCVRPIATENFPVYIQNSREYVVFHSKNFGKMIQMEIGALMVGRIINHEINSKVMRGDEKGYFEFGGSTIVLLFRKNNISMNTYVASKLSEQSELSVVQGEFIAERNKNSPDFHVNMIQ